MVSRQSVVLVRLAGLERAQRFAGESFGHEELAVVPDAGASLSTRLFWAFSGVAALVALTVIGLR